MSIIKQLKSLVKKLKRYEEVIYDGVYECGDGEYVKFDDVMLLLDPTNVKKEKPVVEREIPIKTMKLYKVSRTDRLSYDQFDSMVVIAIDENDARTIHPDGESYLKDNIWHRMKLDYSTREIKEMRDNRGTWVQGGYIGTLQVEYLGEAANDIVSFNGVILASFNAG